MPGTTVARYLNQRLNHMTQLCIIIQDSMYCLLHCNYVKLYVSRYNQTDMVLKSWCCCHVMPPNNHWGMLHQVQSLQLQLMIVKTESFFSFPCLVYKNIAKHVELHNIKIPPVSGGLLFLFTDIYSHVFCNT